MTNANLLTTTSSQSSLYTQTTNQTLDPTMLQSKSNHSMLQSKEENQCL